MTIPTIEIKFGTCSQTNEQILSVWVKTLNDAIKCAGGDSKALLELNRMAKEAVWLTDHLMYQSQAA